MTARLLLRLAPLMALACASSMSARPSPDDRIDPSKGLRHFDNQAIDAHLMAITGNHLAKVAIDGLTVVRAHSPAGLKFATHIYRCHESDNTRCGTIQPFTSWKVSGKEDAPCQLTALGAPKYLIVDPGRLPQGKPYMSRIVLLEQGVIQPSLANEPDLFFKFAGQLDAQLRALPQL
ncbi:hypothetical protein [Erythrobacter sp. THAF29]|uniref:hypothetical protein n=1 Tax=Erythrobacter sp. THAF29 TaxID=2587851 RepID=UPI0012680EAB|nr:hypothetical protein [Erythrobacter sp. THAF29]QFT78510.1 hypothetical protein FIU90_13240 [Erythrobacter sp. THAF29]